MTTKLLPYQAGFAPRHALPPAPKVKRDAPSWLLTLLGLLALDRHTIRAVFRDLRAAWRRSRPQTPAEADEDVTVTLRWLGRAHYGAFPALVIASHLRASTLLVGWIADQARPNKPCALVLEFRAWLAAEGLAA